MRCIVAITIVLFAAAAPLAAQDDTESRMRAWSTALGVQCTHCHVADA